MSFNKTFCLIKDLKIVIGAEEGFEGIRYIAKKFSDVFPKFKLNPTIDDTVNEIVQKLKKVD